MSSSLVTSMNRMNSMFKHLHSVIGGEINKLDATFIKGENVKPVVSRTPKLLKSTNILDQFLPNLASGAVNAFGSEFGGDITDSFDDFAGTGGGPSQGQMWSQAASAINRAMKRGL